MPGSLDLRQIPKWQKELIESTLKLNEANKSGKRGRPSFFKFEEGYLSLYMMKYMWGLPISQIHNYINRIAAELGFSKEGEEYVSRDSIERRFEELEKEIDKIREKWDQIAKQHEEEESRARLVINRFVWNELFEYMKAVKEGREKFDTERVERLVEKISEFNGIKRQFRRWVRTVLGAAGKGESLSTKQLQTRMKNWEIIYEFMLKYRKKANPEQWTKEDFDALILFIKTNLGHDESTYRHVATHIKDFPISQDLVQDLKGFHAGKKHPGRKKVSLHYLYPEEYLRIDEFCSKFEGEKRERCERFKLVLQLHLTTMAREGHKKDIEKYGIDSSLFGLKWQNVDVVKRTIDIYESKTNKTWYGINLDLLFKDLLDNLLQLKKDGDVYIVKDTLGFTYESYKSWLKQFSKFLGKTDEKGRGTLTPHDIRRSGAYWRINYLGLPLESISGFAGGERYYSPFGVGWEDPNTLIGYYASLEMRLQKLLQQFKPLAQELAKDPEKVKQQALNLI
jgi:hypothetical protein